MSISSHSEYLSRHENFQSSFASSHPATSSGSSFTTPKTSLMNMSFLIRDLPWQRLTSFAGHLQGKLWSIIETTALNPFYESKISSWSSSSQDSIFTPNKNSLHQQQIDLVEHLDFYHSQTDYLQNQNYSNTMTYLEKIAEEALLGSIKDTIQGIQEAALVMEPAYLQWWICSAILLAVEEAKNLEENLPLEIFNDSHRALLKNLQKSIQGIKKEFIYSYLWEKFHSTSHSDQSNNCDLKNIYEILLKLQEHFYTKEYRPLSALLFNQCKAEKIIEKKHVSIFQQYDFTAYPLNASQLFNLFFSNDVLYQAIVIETLLKYLYQCVASQDVRTKHLQMIQVDMLKYACESKLYRYLPSLEETILLGLEQLNDKKLIFHCFNNIINFKNTKKEIKIDNDLICEFYHILKLEFQKFIDHKLILLVDIYLKNNQINLICNVYIAVIRIDDTTLKKGFPLLEPALTKAANHLTSLQHFFAILAISIINESEIVIKQMVHDLSHFLKKTALKNFDGLRWGDWLNTLCATENLDSMYIMENFLIIYCLIKIFGQRIPKPFLQATWNKLMKYTQHIQKIDELLAKILRCLSILLNYNKQRLDHLFTQKQPG